MHVEVLFCIKETLPLSNEEALESPDCCCLKSHVFSFSHLICLFNHSHPLNINHVLDTMLRVGGCDVRYTILAPKELTVCVKIDKSA